MKNSSRLFLILFMLSLTLISRGWGNESDLAGILINASNEGRPIPVLSIKYPSVEIDSAYRIQKSFVKQMAHKGGIGGFKAGLTSRESQMRFGVNTPLAGVLFNSGKIKNKAIINKKTFNKLMIEAEIGFIIDKAMTKPLRDIKELKGYIKSVMPVIELPDLGFADLKRLKGVDIIAANVASAKFIAGLERKPEELDINNISVSLFMDGQVINKGKGSDAMGNQWEAAFWLINTMVEQGYEIEAGNTIITGVLGKMIPGNPGRYLADYGSFGRISFEIR